MARPVELRASVCPGSLASSRIPGQCWSPGHFKLDYVNVDGNISNYHPDFLVKLADARTVIVETKGLEDMDVPLKMQRLHQWCDDVNRVQSDVKYDFVFVDQEGFEKYKPKSFRQLTDSFKEYKESA